MMVTASILLAPLGARAENVADKTYVDLVAAAKANPAQVDWAALRLAYASSSFFDLTDAKTADTRKAMWTARQNDDYQGVVKATDTILDQDYADLEAHIMRWASFRALNQPDALAREKAAVDGLMAAVQQGKGTAPETAWNAITVHEEYTVLSLMRLKVIKQSLVNSGNHAYDKFDVLAPDQHAMSVYFLVDQILSAEKRLFVPPAQ